MVSAVVALMLVAAAPTGRAEFETGRRLFLAEQYEEALPHLLRARELSNGRPSTIEAVALCYEKLGDDKNALAEYRALLSADPNRPDAAEVRTKIAALEARVAASPTLAPKSRPDPPKEPDNFASRRAAPPPPIAPPPPVTTPEPSGSDGPPWLWIAIGAVAVVAAGVSVAAIASSGGEPLPESLDRRFVR